MLKLNNQPKSCSVEVKSLLLISIRGLGDAIIQAEFLSSLNQANRDIKIDVLCNDLNRVVFSKFTNYSTKVNHLSFSRFCLSELKNVFLLAWRLRVNRYDAVINVYGDLREDLVGMITGATTIITPRWSRCHPFNSQIYQTPRWVPKRCFIEQIRGDISVYDLINSFKKHFRIDPQTDYDNSSKLSRTPDQPLNIAIHPFASGESRMWDESKWRTVILSIHKMGFKVTVIGTESELLAFRLALGSAIEPKICTFLFLNLDVFLKSLKKFDLMVSMDSFAAHAAYQNRLPNIIINGSNHSAIWAPPGSYVIENGYHCVHYPCANQPRCIKSGVDKYMCIKSVTVDQVLESIVYVSGLIKDGNIWRIEKPKNLRNY